jgi:purine-binding chemotaxis protein CheW
MTTRVWLVLFRLDSLRLALPLGAVERVVPVVAVTPLPGLPTTVSGAFNLAGEVVPVLNLRPQFRLREGRQKLTDHLLVARSRGRAVALLVDEVQEVIELDPVVMVPPAEIAAGAQAIQGVVRLHDGLLLVSDPDRFLNVRDSEMLDLALEEAADGDR